MTHARRSRHIRRTLIWHPRDCSRDDGSVPEAKRDRSGRSLGSASQSPCLRGTIADVGADDFTVKRQRKDVVRVRYSELVSVSKPKINQAGWMVIGGAADGLGAWAFCTALHCNQ